MLECILNAGYDIPMQGFTFDGPALEEAVRALLRALGRDPGDPELSGTPATVARAWRERLLDGYGKNAADALGRGYAVAVTAQDLVVVRGLEVHGVCPHHLMVWRGTAAIGYLPQGRVVGFSRLGRLLDALAHRLVLQEAVARDAAHALVQHLGAAGAACWIDAEHLCMTVAGEGAQHARAAVEAFAGRFLEDAGLRERFARMARG
jgi:GTP cyclohydrolase I